MTGRGGEHGKNEHRQDSELRRKERQGQRSQRERDTGEIQEQSPRDQHGRTDKRNRKDDYGA
jgi:hypothetical protein